MNTLWSNKTLHKYRQQEDLVNRPYFAGPCYYKLCISSFVTTNHLGILINTDSNTVGLGPSFRVYIFHKYTDDADAAGIKIASLPLWPLLIPSFSSRSPMSTLAPSLPSSHHIPPAPGPWYMLCLCAGLTFFFSIIY